MPLRPRSGRRWIPQEAAPPPRQTESACYFRGVSSEPAIPGLRRVVVSAPFGNYVQPGHTTPTMGTFTLARRRGRVGAILRTVRPYPKLGAWVNRIGLRNPGISWLEGKAAKGYALDDKLVSVHGFNDDEWAELVDRGAALSPLGLELNMSCPNVAHQAPPAGLFARAAACGVPVVVKLPPLRFRPMVDAALAAGLRAFHCCNTLPVKGGGMSGRPLKPLSLEVIEKLRAMPGGSRLTIIGGGGHPGGRRPRRVRGRGCGPLRAGHRAHEPGRAVLARAGEALPGAGGASA